MSPASVYMGMLSRREEEICTMVYDKGHSYRNVADWLGLRIGTVKTLAYRIQCKYRERGMTLPDNRKPFVTK